MTSVQRKIIKPANALTALVVIGATLVCLTGCGTLHPRKPLPAGLSGKASPPGYQDIRDWGDHFSPVLQRSVKSALKKEAKQDNPYGQTPIQYLSLSGGGMNGAFGAGFLCGWTAQGSRPNFDFVTDTTNHQIRTIL